MSKEYDVLKKELFELAFREFAHHPECSLIHIFGLMLTSDVGRECARR
ncbi:MAG TPA: hypothetical protein VJT08_12180 [Terriglobales bacterium]|nr:hypothetical protein [Terriglobales bacterium]